MGTLPFFRTISDNTKEEVNNEYQKEQLVFGPKDKVLIFRRPSKISVYDVYAQFRELLHTKRRTKDILLDCNIADNPKGLNTRWRIDLSFFCVVFRFRSFLFGRNYQGFISCHQTGDFTTYCVRVGEVELWFDSYELALASFSPKNMLGNDAANDSNTMVQTTINKHL